MLVCQQCGYALYRSSAQTSKQKLYYYSCIGSDAYRHLCGPVCTNRPIRQDYLDQFVWQEIIRVLEEPELIQAKIQRPSAERLPPAYQENLLTLAELRRRMPELRKHQQAMAAGWGTPPAPHNRLTSAVNMNMLNYNVLLARLAPQLRHRCQLLDEEPHQPARSEHMRS